jgi:molecular chaperone GrpE
MEEKELEKLKQERDEYLNGWKRSKADFINYKREEHERMRALAEYVRSAVVLRVLPILDSLSRAEKEIPEDQKGSQVVKGFLQIVSQWQEFLKQEGIVAIETVGKPFNPEFHEAVVQEEGLPGQGGESGMVVEEVEKGYIMNGKLLRPAKVKISK